MLLLLPLGASAFGTSTMCKSAIQNSRNVPVGRRQIITKTGGLMAARSDNPVEENSSSIDAPADPPSNKKYARAGGRRPRTESKSTPSTNNGNDIFLMFRQVALPLCLLALLLRFLFGMFGGSASNPNVVYYSRSTYQSTTYAPDGKVETTRKEDFRSNIPGLVDYRKDGNENKYYIDSIDEDLSDLEDGMDALLFRKW